MFTFLCEYQPDVHHLEIGCGRKALRDTDEEGGEDEEGGQVDSHHSFEKEIFEEICSIYNDEDEDGWKVDCEDGIAYSSLQNNLDMDPLLYITWGKYFLLQAL